MNSEYKISVIIATYKRYQKLYDCLQSLVECSGRYDKKFEVIVVDDGGRLCKKIEKEFEKLDIKWVYLAHNSGQPAAQGTGADRAKGEILAFLDDDAVVDAHWLSAIEHCFEQYPDIGAVVGKINPIDTGHLLPRMRQQIYERRHREYMDGTAQERIREKYGYSTSQNVPLSDHISGGNFAIYGSVLKQIGGFSRNLSRGSDGEMTRRLLMAHVLVAYEPEMIIFHHHNTKYLTLFKNNIEEGKTKVKSACPEVSLHHLWKKALTDLVMSPFRILRFPEMFEADRFYFRVYFVYWFVQLFDAIGQVSQCVIFSFPYFFSSHRRES